jgi:7,8-dihydropterin-6-yl-methyl-4-(beta-D-ribofuranosyl)aminobenzene 5'-phosphate synthase
MTVDNLRIKEVDHIEITTIIDNYVDVLLESSGIITRPVTERDGVIFTDTLLAEHGLSLLLQVARQESRTCLLFDTGHSQLGVLHNLTLLDLDPNAIDAIVISHFHMDHTGSLYPLIDHMRQPVPVIVHPDAFKSPRTLHMKDGSIRKFPVTLSREALEKRRIPLIESKGPMLFGDDMILITGEIERITSFEKGLPNAYMERGGRSVKDPVLCDQALVMNLKKRGLVVISGCSHAGIVNTIHYAMKITGIKNLYALIGGFHLGGPQFEPIIEETIKAVKALDPQVVVPMHCTGQKAIQRFKEAFPDAFILNSVGSRVTLKK